MAQSSLPYPKRASNEVSRRTVPLMGTFVTIEVVGPAAHLPQAHPSEINNAIERAFDWFYRVEECCTRFEPRSEVMQLTSRPEVAVPASAILFEAVQFALAVAGETRGAFDPTIGHAMETRGFNREYRTGQTVRTGLTEGAVSYRDVRLNPVQQTITLLRPLILDLGAVAKGLAIDLAARELQPFENFAIDAGGDLYLAGCNAKGELWSVGISHPRRSGELLDTVTVSNRAVCTSGDYERSVGGGSDGNHILDPRSGHSAKSAISATVLAPTAMMGDAISTAAFVLGPSEGIHLFERMGVEGFIVTPSFERFATKGFPSAV
ncbi:MAG: FAD:protein FMN transferase [Candidatus Acidiferrales bacterium]